MKIFSDYLMNIYVSLMRKKMSIECEKIFFDYLKSLPIQHFSDKSDKREFKKIKIDENDCFFSNKQKNYFFYIRKITEHFEGIPSNETLTSGNSLHETSLASFLTFIAAIIYLVFHRESTQPEKEKLNDVEDFFLLSKTKFMEKLIEAGFSSDLATHLKNQLENFSLIFTKFGVIFCFFQEFSFLKDDSLKNIIINYYNIFNRNNYEASLSKKAEYTQGYQNLAHLFKDVKIAANQDLLPLLSLLRSSFFGENVQKQCIGNMIQQNFDGSCYHRSFTFIKHDQEKNRIFFLINSFKQPKEENHRLHRYTNTGICKKVKNAAILFCAFVKKEDENSLIQLDCERSVLISKNKESIVEINDIKNEEFFKTQKFFFKTKDNAETLMSQRQQSFAIRPWLGEDLFNFLSIEPQNAPEIKDFLLSIGKNITTILSQDPGKMIHDVKIENMLINNKKEIIIIDYEEIGATHGTPDFLCEFFKRKSIKKILSQDQNLFLKNTIFSVAISVLYYFFIINNQHLYQKDLDCISYIYIYDCKNIREIIDKKSTLNFKNELELKDYFNKKTTEFTELIKTATTMLPIEKGKWLEKYFNTVFLVALKGGFDSYRSFITALT